MSDDFEQQEWLKFGVAATLSKQYAADERQFLEQLAVMLESALSGEIDITRKGSFFTKKRVQRVMVTFGDNRYTLEDQGRGPLQAAKIRIVRGIALKTESMTVPDWLTEIGAALDERARTSAQARAALSRLVG